MLVAHPFRVAVRVPVAGWVFACTSERRNWDLSLSRGVSNSHQIDQIDPETYIGSARPDRMGDRVSTGDRVGYRTATREIGWLRTMSIRLFRGCAPELGCAIALSVLLGCSRVLPFRDVRCASLVRRWGPAGPTDAALRSML